MHQSQASTRSPVICGPTRNWGCCSSLRLGSCSTEQQTCGLCGDRVSQVHGAGHLRDSGSSASGGRPWWYHTSSQQNGRLYNHGRPPATLQYQRRAQAARTREDGCLPRLDGAAALARLRSPRRLPARMRIITRLRTRMAIRKRTYIRIMITDNDDNAHQ